MVRKACGLVLALALAAGQSVQANDPTSLLGGRKVRFLSVAVARIAALEQESVGQPALIFPGIGLDHLVEFRSGKAAPSAWGDVRVFARVDDPMEYILTRSGCTKSRYEFEREVSQKLLNVETAYWNLYGAYGNLHGREQAMRFAYQTWRIVKAQFDAGSKNSADLAQCRGQYELFRTQRVQALDTVLDNERQLRALMGMPIEDGTRLVPCDAPKVRAYKPDWKASLQEAHARRPELAIARKEVKAARLNLKLTENLLLPDLRFTAAYDTTGIGKQVLAAIPTTPCGNWPRITSTTGRCSIASTCRSAFALPAPTSASPSCNWPAAMLPSRRRS